MAGWCNWSRAGRAWPWRVSARPAPPSLAGAGLAALDITRQATWATAHSQYAAQPTPDRPDGAVIATTAPHRWTGEPVRVLDLT
ncbi:hypothetical protein [Streptomyces caniscabiei]|uniref:hypothetical protein n=1 Tax=Streptomyces caniscabiei TaxID=2746961 RepID=UPI0007660C6C|nr:hypothetical protein [Streptomyces caniscabiei]